MSISLLDFWLKSQIAPCSVLGEKETSFDSVYQRKIVWPNSDQTVSAQQKLEAMPVVPFFGPYLTIRHVDKQLVGSQDPKFDL